MRIDMIERVGQVPVSRECLKGKLSSKSNRRRIFLLSPANASKMRGICFSGLGALCFGPRLRNEGASLGEFSPS